MVWRVVNLPGCFRELASPAVAMSAAPLTLPPTPPGLALSLSPPGKEVPHLCLI